MSQYIVPERYNHLIYADIIRELDLAQEALENKLDSKSRDDAIASFMDCLTELEKNAEALCIYAEYLKINKILSYEKFSSDDLLVISARLYQKALEIIDEAKRNGLEISDEQIFRYRLYAALGFYASRRHAISAAISRKLEEDLKKLKSESSPVQWFYSILIELMRLDYQACNEKCSLSLTQIRQKIIDSSDIDPTDVVFLPFLGSGIKAISQFTDAIQRGHLLAADKSANQVNELAKIFDKLGYTEISFVFSKLSFSLKNLIDFSVWRVREILPNSTAEQIVEVNSFINQKIGDKRYFLFNSQYQALFEDKILERNNHQVLSMPTGAGKTLLAQLLLFKELLLRPDPTFKIIYIVPTRSLAYEKLVEFEAVFQKNGLKYRVCKITGEILIESREVIENNDILIMTQEKFDMLMRENFCDFPIKCVISDEFHNVFENSRGLRLQLSLVRFKQNSQNQNSNLYLISAILPKIDQDNIARWLYPEENSKDVIFQTFWQPTFTRRGYFDFIQDGKKPKWAIQFNDGKTLKINSPKKPLRTNATVQAAAFLAAQFSQTDQVYLYSHSKGDIFRQAKYVSSFLTGIDTQYINQEMKIGYSKKIRRIIGENPFTELFEHGVAVHHGDLPLIIRNIIEESIKNRAVPVVVATSTLAQGVNLPIKTIVISKPQLGKEVMDFGSFLNLIGRAGRPYLTDEGQVILLTTPDRVDRRGFSEERIKEFLDAEPRNIDENLSPVLLLEELANEGLTDTVSYNVLLGVFESMLLAVIAEKLYESLDDERIVDAITFSSKSEDSRKFVKKLLHECEERFIEKYEVVVKEGFKLNITEKGLIFYQSGFSPDTSLTSINWLKGNLPLLNALKRINYNINDYNFGDIWKCFLISFFSCYEGQAIFNEDLKERWIWGSLSWMKEVNIEQIAAKGYRKDILNALSEIDGNMSSFIAWGFYAMSKWVKLIDYPHAEEMEFQLQKISSYVWYGANTPIALSLLKKDVSKRLLRDDALILSQSILAKRIQNFIEMPDLLKQNVVKKSIIELPQLKVEGTEIYDHLKAIFEIS